MEARHQLQVVYSARSRQPAGLEQHRHSEDSAGEALGHLVGAAEEQAARSVAGEPAGLEGLVLQPNQQELRQASSTNLLRISQRHQGLLELERRRLGPHLLLHLQLLPQGVAFSGPNRLVWRQRHLSSVVRQPKLGAHLLRVGVSSVALESLLTMRLQSRPYQTSLHQQLQQPRLQQHQQHRQPVACSVSHLNLQKPRRQLHQRQRLRFSISA